MLTAYHSNRVERLVDALADVLRQPPPGADADAWTLPETVVVQSLGMETWLSMELAKRLGVCANVRFPFPREVVDWAFTAVLGERPFVERGVQPDVLTWAIMARLPSLLDQAEFKALARYIDGPNHDVRLYQLARRVADLFDQYALYRPSLVREWEARDLAELRRAAKKGDGLGADQVWQPILWNELLKPRRLVALSGADDAAFAAAFRGADLRAHVPARLSVFGVSSLPPLYWRVWRALAEQIDLHLFVVSPSPEYWADLRDPRVMTREAHAEADRYDESPQPLLASLGRVGRETQESLNELANSGVEYGEREDLFEEPVAPPGTMLEVVQADIFHVRRRSPEAGGEPPCALDPRDESIVIHSCHSPMREVEVLRDQLRHAFEADPDLHPHDVIVMAPEIELYGPFIEAVFGAPEFEPSVTPSYIPYRVSDRSLRRDAPTLEAFLAVLHLTAGRLTIEEVFDLLQADAVRARFGLTTADLDRAKRWARESGVRWGISGEHRAAAFSQPGFGENTWRFGLDRLLLGYAMPGRDDRLFADTGVVPYDEIEGHDALVLGRFAHFCETLFAQLTALRGPRPASAWQDALRHMLDALTVADDTTDYERQIIVAALGRLTELTALGGFAGPLDREVVRRFLEAHFARERHAVGFVSGAVTFCNLLPMRTIPFKIVCLLGMDDDRIPRPSQTLNFDLLRAKRLAGDRSLRDEDRYMFLEALLAARQRLIITYVGQSIRDNSVRPPSVLVSELLDVLGDGFRLPHTDGESLERRRAAVRDHLVVRHPLQEFSPRYFRADKDERLRNYHDTACRGARMLLDKNTPEHAAPPIFIDERNLLPLAADETVVVRLEDLHQFFKDPAKYLLERRLDLLASRDPDETAEREPLVLDGLEKYQLGELMLARELKEDDLEAYLPRVRALGKLPLGAMGEAQFAQLAEPVRRLAAAARASTTGGKLPPLDIDLAFDDARVSGRIGDIWPAARVIAAYASSKAERELRLWINHLFLLASAAPGYPRRSVFVGRDSFSFSGCDADPREFAADLLRIFLAGRQRPIRFFPEVSRTYADSAQTKPPADALREAEKKWRAHPQSDREAEAEKPKIRRLYGEVDPLRDPIDDPGLSFAALAVRVWGPLLRNRREGEK